ncbi:MAG: glycoside hydrolase family 2 TIM barrel-domain containing protein, partial [Myxococcota bacterium]|nr:glycoside hydrolase family 2 TIM barrel-domain containing protein [Myxococcota bacterium]
GRPEFGPPNFAGNVERDARMMAAIGINVVKLYSPLTNLDVLDTLYAHGIHVVQPVFGYWDTNGDQRFDDLDLDEIDRVVEGSKRGGKVHPAIIMWSVGNEWNYNGFYNEGQWGNGHCWSRDGNQGGPPPSYACPDAVDVAIRAFQRVKTLDSTTPLSTIWGEVPAPELVDRIDPFIDVWASNVYRYNSFGQPPDEIFSQFRAITDKPFYVGEYGCDAWNTTTGQLDEVAQATCNTGLAQRIVEQSTLNGGDSIGGFLFEWNDEWWKVANGQVNMQESTPGGVPGAGPAPDARFNEEYWGIVDLFRTPRQSYYLLCPVENPMPGIQPAACPEAESNPIGGETECQPASAEGRLIIDVDLRAYPQPVNFVRLIGSLWDWDPDDGPVATDLDRDGIYRVTFDGLPEVEFDYKWRINQVDTEILAGAGDCVGNAIEEDRAHRRWSPGEPNRVDVFGGCDVCRADAGPANSLLCPAAAAGPSLIIDVDMRAYPGPIDLVRLVGTFWGWDPDDGPVATDLDGDGIYRVAFDGMPGAQLDYKWRINRTIIEDLSGAGDCAGNTNVFDLANRRWTPGQPNRVDVYESCAQCIQ